MVESQKGGELNSGYEHQEGCYISSAGEALLPGRQHGKRSIEK